MDKVLKNLEKNTLDVCNPHLAKYVSKYPKISYKLPNEITELMDDMNNQPWRNILQKVNLRSIHLTHEQSNG